MRRFLQALAGGVAVGVVVVGAAYVLRHGAMVAGARQVHETLTRYMIMGFISSAAAATALVAAAGSVIRWRRNRRRPGGYLGRTASW